MAKTVKVRVAVAVSGKGDWYAVGLPAWKQAEVAAEAADAVGDLRDPAPHIYWLTAELPIPEPVQVELPIPEPVQVEAEVES